MVPLSFAGEEWLLTRSGALFWPRESALLVADLHLEKGSFFASRGQMIPPYDSRETLGRLAEAIRDTGALTIFPEGTTSDGMGLLPFKSSLLSALDPVPQGIVVQPLWLDYGPEVAGIAWVGQEHGLTNFMRILARKAPVRLDVHFLPPLEGEMLANRKTIAAAAREAILRTMQAQRVAL